MTKIIGIDAETDGLYGMAFAIAVTVREDGKEVARFEGRTGDNEIKDKWVQKNVLPALKDMPVTHKSSDELEEAFWFFWEAHKDGAAAIAHMGSPVESGLFRRCVERGDLDSRQFNGPFPLHEVSTALYGRGENPTSVDAYNEKHNLEVPFDGIPHHPSFDAIAAAVAWEHLHK